MEGKILLSRLIPIDDTKRKDWNDSGTTVLNAKKLVLLKKILFLHPD